MCCRRIGFVITKVVTTPKVEIDYGTSDIYTQKDMDEAIKVIKRKIRHMKGFELHKVYYAVINPVIQIVF